MVQTILTSEQLQEIYKTNYNYFLELANTYYKNDRIYYDEVVYPVILHYKNNPTGATITCPFCQNKIAPITHSSITTGGIVMIVAGILLSPILVGIILIIIGASMKDIHKSCPSCGMKLQ
jgi:hypothetical protein